jgi:uncharacterized protein YegJ (DUF2314 family)
MRFILAFCLAATFTAHLLAVPPGEEGNTSPIVKLAEMDRLTAPYVAKARATYPAAKKRFLAGLPQGHKFIVMFRFSQRDKRTGEAVAEDMLVQVERIEKGRIIGRLANAPVLVRNIKYGDTVSRPEPEITNWLIEHPDRSEEGNFVGKFLEKHFERK